MVQIIEQEDLGQRLGTSIGSSSSAMIDKILSNKLNSMSQQSTLSNLDSLMGGGQSPSQREPGGQVEEEFMEISPSKLIAAEMIAPGSGKILQADQDRKRSKFEEGKAKSKLQTSMSNMLKVLPAVGPGKYLNKLSSEGRKKRQYFDSLTMQLEEKAATMVGKGTLSKARFQFLLKNLPSSSKTQAANMGAIKAWSQILGVDVPGLQGNDFEDLNIEEISQGRAPGEETILAEKEDFSSPEGEEEVTEESLSDEGEGKKAITIEIATEFLKKAKGDKEKARKLARKYGYEF